MERGASSGSGADAATSGFSNSLAELILLAHAIVCQVAALPFVLSHRRSVVGFFGG